MLVYSIKENIVRNVMIPILSALFLFLIGILIINWQLWQMAKMNNVHTATVSIQKIESILSEAVSAANTARCGRALTAG